MIKVKVYEIMHFLSLSPRLSTCKLLCGLVTAFRFLGSPAFGLDWDKHKYKHTPKNLL